MTDLTKREAFYFMLSALGGLAVLISILAFWSASQPKCWEQFSTEDEAIAVCEQ